jgi:CubicO group peptidase (beta-lactamase class C family)
MVLADDASHGRTRFADTAAIVDGARRRGVFPAAVAETGTGDGVLWREAFGRLTFESGEVTGIGTIFDLASLTKPIATTTVILAMCERRQIRLGDPVAAFVPEWRGAEREQVTVRDLLEHTSGLSARLLDRPPADRRAFEHEICTMPLEYVPRTRAIYSDLGFILLGFVAESVGRGSLAEQTAVLLDPIAAAFDDPAAHLLVAVGRVDRPRTAPTLPLPEDERRGRPLVGEVHDNYAAALGGFAGHAGLFGTAAGVGAMARAVLLALRGSPASLPFSSALLRRAVTRGTVPGSSRALGWDTMLPTSSCGTRMSSSAFGHVGFTGTSLWIDPECDRYYVLLTNRVCGGGTSDDMQQVRRAFHDAIAAK